ncbi:hypothetical protein TNCV_3017371 [Trichonephila clavipes]|nr:hypothetical protein TNCV_3017371 [Trichonephila clavipes]
MFFWERNEVEVRFDLDTFRFKNEYLNHNAKMIVIAWRPLLAYIDIPLPQGKEPMLQASVLLFNSEASIHKCELNKHNLSLKCVKNFQTAWGGRVRSTTPAEDRYIVLSAKRNRRTTAQQVANQFLAASEKQIFRKTVARRLRGGGLYARRPVVCVPLTRQHRTARLQWCCEHHTIGLNRTGHAYYSQMRVGSVCHRIVDAN